jgi:hypothetical protein
LFSATGLAQYQADGLQLFLEVGARSPEAAQTLSSVIGKMPDFPKDVTKALQRLEDIDARSYPLTIRMYTPGGWTVQVSKTPPYFLAVIDARGEIPVKEWIAERTLPGIMPLDLRQRRLHDGTRRYLIGNDWDKARRELKKLRGDELPDPSPAQTGLLARVSRSRVYGFLDLRRLATEPQLRKLRAAGGRDGVMVALGADKVRGAWNLDIHWSTRPGQGMVGAFLPSRSEPCGLEDLLPWKPGLALQANPGSSFARRLARMNIARMVPANEGRAVLETLLDVWEGPIGFYQPEPHRNYRPARIAPPTLQLSPEYIFLIGVDPDSGDGILETLAEALGPGARRSPTGTFAFGTRRRSMLLGHRRGVLVLCNTESPETSAQYVEHVFAAIQGNRKPKWHMDYELKGMVQMWLSPGASRYLAKRSGKHRPATLSLGGNWLSSILGTQGVGNGLGLSLFPDKYSLRLRVRF